MHCAEVVMPTQTPGSGNGTLTNCATITADSLPISAIQRLRSPLCYYRVQQPSDAAPYTETDVKAYQEREDE
jgi:hypothetical protein